MKTDPITIKVAAIQMNCVLNDVERNLGKAKVLIDEAIEQGAQIIVLPELFNTGYRVEENDVEMAESIPGPTTKWMQQIAYESNVLISASILETGLVKEMVYNTGVLVGAKGLVGTYRKVNLWEMEKLRFAKGVKFPVYETIFGKIGIQICYDIGFPEGARILAMKGADIIVYPSAFGKARLYAWDIATQSRALENGTFIIAANRSGIEKEETTFGGHSRIVDPSGLVLTQAENEEEVIVTEINLNKVKTQRREIPYLRDLRKGLFYQEWITST